ncbi:uncharacterized protein B0H18DRAFT_1207681 [Fomitopsis serialis]|uniref:uncharacterized protein n=1 Tax=Fomitopsis serialis TaxID=139415 RepID=UPI0020087F39|nr:uncharacterized protein B0H18DRAFT_1207681 [Neoantrodia serialis]KAH9934133.1 hypothetical protein B0H18DRAFT_1207681 [Neoantrodia serialis]
MVDADSSQEPRRSQRDRKQATHFVPVNSSLLKRKRSDETSDDDARSELSDPASQADEAEVGDEFDAPKTKPKTSTKTKRKAKEPKEAGAPPAAKKPRATKKATIPKTVRSASRATTCADAPEFDAEQVAKETKISADNSIFNAIINPTIALQSVAEDFLESLSRTPGLSLAELINCVLRAFDKLDDFTEILKKDDSPIYPLTSKLPVFKRFRTSLSEVIARIITSSAAHGSLYSSDLMATLQTWVVAMSSSQLRSFRHTATVIALEVETALCDVAAAVENEAEIVSRQREGERKRKAAAGRGADKSKAATAREKELESKAAEVRERRAKLAEFLKEFVDGVFVHRYRDLDPSIRAECVRAMGLWFAKYPAHFLDGAYLRYVGWVLSDAQTPVRLEAVRALTLAYEQTAYIGAAALQHFTERFKPRLVEMALGDTELSVRVAVVQVLKAIDGHGLLEDEQREKLCLLVFDEETRVRRAVGGFVKGVWEESVEERLVGRKPTGRDKTRAGFKGLGMLLVQWGRALNTEGDQDDEDDLGEGTSKQVKEKNVASIVGTGQQKGRIALAVEALWDEIEPLSDWENLLEMLLLDHSAAGGDTSSQESMDRDEGVDNAWRLEEAEEAVLLEMLIAVLRKTKADASGGKKGEDETVASDITRALMKALPKLFVKHQTDENRMADVLLIPQLMNVELYLEMRMMTAYANLWEDITKQFTSHSSPVVLTNAVTTIRHLMDATSLSNTNSTQILELEDGLSVSLRDAIANRDEIEIASFNEDEVIKIAAICARLAALIGIRDMTSWMEEDEGGKQSSAWDIMNALAERGRLGYKEEELMVDRALQVLTLHIIWKARNLTATEGDLLPEEQRFQEKLQEQRDALLEKLLEFAIGTQSNTAEGVRRAAFQNLMNLHILFCPTQSIAPDGSRLPTASLPLSLDDETQYRCAGYIQAAIERYADELEEASPSEGRRSDEDEDSNASDPENDGPAKGGKTTAGKTKQVKKTSEKRPVSRSQLEKEYIFIGVIATFLRAIRAGVIHFRHSATLLAHYGRLGPAFDLCAKVIVDILREEGMYKENGDAVVAVICQGLRDSFSLLLDGMVYTEDHTVALGKTLRACLIIRGAQLTVVKKLEGKFVVNIHTSLLTWTTKRIAAYENAKNKKARNKCILFFKAMLPLLSTLDNRDALIVKAHYDQVLAQNQLEVPPTAQPWEPCRAYERKLTTIMSKDKASAKRTKGGRGGEVVTTDDEGTGAETADENPAPARPQPKPRPRRRAARGAEHATDTEGHASDSGAGPIAASTPKARPRPRRATRKKASTESPISPLTPSPEPNVAAREDERSEGEPEDDTQTPRASQFQDEAEVPQPNLSQETQADEIQIRRKRIRH